MFGLVKKTGRKCVYKFCVSSKDTLNEKISKYPVISFDVFDTLIKRDVPEPDYVFRLVEKQYDKLTRGKSDFYSKRLKAESDARMSLGTDINIDEIYDFYEGNDKELLKKMELDVELDICTASPIMLSVFYEAVKQNKKIILISDMYLKSDFIIALLDNCGITGYRKLFVSCEVRKNKASGALYDYIRQVENIKEEWLHIGDSVKGDYISPKLKGIKSCLISRQFKTPLYYQGKDRNLMSFIQNHESVEYDDYQKIGYEILGPIIYGFAYWLHKEISSKQYDKVLFLARDSALLLKAYSKMYGDENKNKYIYISRKAALSCVSDLISDYEELHDLYVPKDSDTVGILYSALKIPEEKQYQINNILGVDSDTFINSSTKIDGDTLFTQLNLKSNKDAINQRILFNEYMNQIGVRGRYAVVDVGWEGRTQWALDRISTNDSKAKLIDGYYFGVIKKYPRLTQSLNMNSYIGILKNTDVNARVIMESVALFETMFLSKEGSTIAYERLSDGEIVPVKGEPDQDIDNLYKVEALQKSAMKFVEDMKDSIINEHVSWEANDIFDIYKKFAVYPSKYTVKVLRKWQFRDRETHILGSEHNILFYILNPACFKRDIWNSYYRVLFLRDLFKVPFPYFNLLYKYYYHKHHKCEE